MTRLADYIDPVIVRARADEVERTHRLIHETWRDRDLSDVHYQAWLAATEEVKPARRTLYSPDLDEVAAGISRGDPVSIEAAIVFLEVDEGLRTEFVHMLRLAHHVRSPEFAERLRSLAETSSGGRHDAAGRALAAVEGSRRSARRYKQERRRLRRSQSAQEAQRRKHQLNTTILDTGRNRPPHRTGPLNAHTGIRMRSDPWLKPRP